MKIKRTIGYRLKEYTKKKEGTYYCIVARICFNNDRLDVVSGSKVNSKAAWDSSNHIVKPGFGLHGNKLAAQVNADLGILNDAIDETFKSFEIQGVYPTKREYKAELFSRWADAPIHREELQRKGIKERKREKEAARIAAEKALKDESKRIEEKKKKEKKKKHGEVLDVFDKFVEECGVRNAWSNATYQKWAAFRNDLEEVKIDLKFSDFDEHGLTRYVIFLRDEKILKTPRKKIRLQGNDKSDADEVGLMNSTIKKKLRYLTWFMNWATLHGFNSNMAYKTFRPTLKEAQKKVIYLTIDELNKLMDLDLSQNYKSLEPIRDVFVFCCYTGLRHSDAENLLKSDVKQDHIEVTTIKTADTLTIELNDVSAEILNKYKDIPLPGGKALPVYANQVANRELKVLCKLAGINEPIRITTYTGSVRKDVVKEKWELIGTHCGRRTFIVNALSSGIPPNIVMKWTGHSDYKAMKPYIDIVDSAKAASMALFNERMKRPVKSN